MNPPLASNNMYGRDSPNALFTDLMRGGNGSPMFSNPSPPSNPSPGFASGSQTNYQNSYLSGVNNMGVDSSLPPISFSPAVPPATMQQQQQQQQQANQMSPPDQAEEDDDPNKSEAYKLIQYVLFPAQSRCLMFLAATTSTITRGIPPTAYPLLFARHWSKGD